MNRIVLSLLISGLALSAVVAEDEITVRSREKPVKGVIKGESAKGVLVGKEAFAPEEIVDIYYDVPAAPDVKFGVYSGARNEEKDSLDPAKESKRKTHLQNALEKYKEAHAKAKEGVDKTKDADAKTRTEPALRHFKFKIAMLQVRLAQEDGEPVDAGLKALLEFKTAHRASWQIVPAMRALAQVHLSKSEFKEAAAVYEELAGYDVSEDEQLEAQIEAASVSIRAKKQDEAMKKLEALLAKLPKGSKHAVRAQIAIGECLAAQGKAGDAVKHLRGIIGGTTDKAVKAAAYNALGESLMKNDQYKEARWEFLRVDLLYNQDRIEHARALFNLCKTFDALGEGDRALECKQMLANDRQFAGLEQQRWAARELAVEKKSK